MHREPAPGMSVHRQQRETDILKRRLLRSVLTFWNVATFKIDIQDLATIDVLGVCISHTLVPYLCTRVCVHIGVGFALSVLISKAMRQPQKVELAKASSTLLLYTYV